MKQYESTLRTTLAIKQILLGVSAVIVTLVATVTPMLRAHASTQYLSTLTPTDFGGYGVGSTAHAQSFNTGNASPGYLLSSITLAMGGREVGASGFGVSIYSNGSSIPGASLGTLTGNSNPGVGAYTYTASGLVLDPATTYWIVASAVGPATYTWRFTHATDYAATDGWSIDAAGLCQAYHQASYGQWAPTIAYNGLFEFSLEASVIPEPATTALLLAGFGGLLLMRRAR